MPELLLIMAPLLVLAAVLFLGYAGCDYDPPVPPPATLTFRANVPTTLTVPSGVTFAWTRPTGVAETQTVTTFTTGGTNNVYEHPIPTPEPDPGWLGRCEMTVQEDGQAADASSGDDDFELPDAGDFVLLFETDGSPLAPPFRVIGRGLMQV